MATIGDGLVRRQLSRFVGRDAEIGVFRQALAGGLDHNVLFVHGPGGLGKTSLLRMMRLLAAEAGRRCYWVDARALAPVPDAVVDALAEATAHDGERAPVVFIDSFERIGACGRTLRQDVLPKLADDSVVVISGRRPPDSGWRLDGWDQVVAELPLGALTPAEAQRLLRAHGVTDDTVAERLRGWSEGSPLALTLAAGAYLATGATSPRPTTVSALFEVVTEAELDPAFHDALTVCAIAREVTVELLAHTLGEPREAFDWLAERSFVDSYGDSLTLHDVVRMPVLARVRQSRPDRVNKLKRLLCDHFYARALSGDAGALVDLAHLIDSPEIRWGYRWEGSSRFQTDRVRVGDAEVVGHALTTRGYDEWWAMSEAYYSNRPQNVTIARDAAGSPVGHAIFLTPSALPVCSRIDPFGARLLRYAQRISPDGQAVVWRDTVDLTGEGSHVLAMLNLSVVLRMEVRNPRYAIVSAFGHNDRVHAFCTATGGRPIPELETDVDGRRVVVYLIDYGPGGLYVTQRDIVYRELGVCVPTAVTAADVRAALDGFASSGDLAQSPLARGADTRERAEHVRAVLRSAVELEFGTSPHERQLSAALTQRFFDGRESHEKIARSLALSRATYFRRLNEAVSRLTEHLVRR
ncbi:ATP-binding protein [Allokutzneria sp. NRRL B-24872]|uniref:ATP-binding protein n=1 Tax=Allokutzneria sp. NRRL B-24872 TaxID=1137961 RepID=UPI000A3D324F|nr:ATP-binding protein [Allokutzneria sp. NRRL B-24872]